MLKTELNAAVSAVRVAARVCRDVQQRRVTPVTLEKRDKSPVTVADFASQAIICATLADALPADRIVGEENADELRRAEQATLRAAVVEHVAAVRPGCRADDVLAWIDRGGFDPGSISATTGDRYWTLDPIDGTKGFLRGEQYAIALALLVDRQVVLGVLGCPNLPMPGAKIPGVLMFAVRGGGTFSLPLWDEHAGIDAAGPVRVSELRDTRGVRLCESVESGHSDQGRSASIAAKLGITAQPLRMDSQCKYAAVARGEASIYLRLPTKADYRECIWDHAAGMICVEEAGGRVTDIDGRPLDFHAGRKFDHNRGVIATSGPIHAAVLAAVAGA
jgi:3'(2'), 5'-bisphosphate nucleotidase